jgi:hypothetical protein
MESVIRIVDHHAARTQDRIIWMSEASQPDRAVESTAL